MAKAGRDLVELLTDLIEWGERVSRIVASTSRSAILENEMAEHALERVVEVFGDLAGHIQRGFPVWCADHFPEEFSDAYRLRNKLAHGYDSIRPDFLYDIAERDVASLTFRARVWRDELMADDQP